jgi:AraC family transcriptional regulator, positive regulator of tynA and feaB
LLSGDGESWIIDARARDDKVARWEQMLSAVYLPWAVAIPNVPCPAGFQARLRRWWIDDLALVDCECDPCSGARNRRQLADTEGEFVGLLILRTGAETTSQGGLESTLAPGDAVVWDSTKPSRFGIGQPLSKRMLLMPRAALDEVAGRRWPAGGLKLDGAAPATRLLTTYLDTLSQVRPGLSPDAVSAARTAALELFADALRPGSGISSAQAVRPALRAAIERFIDQHLLYGAVTPAAIAAAHGVSVRTVNRVFSATGHTVHAVVRLRRLARAREELTGTDQPISVIAHRWGFSDTSHFSRTFKAHYGSSPASYHHATRSRGPRCDASVQRHVGRVQSLRGPGYETGVTAARG